MKIEERSIGEVTILDLSGKLASSDANVLLHDKIHSLVFQGKHHIVLNLGDVSSVDSSGLGTLCASITTVRNDRGDIKLVNLTKRMHDLLAITRLLTVFETYDSEDAAVASFSPTACV